MSPQLKPRIRYERTLIVCDIEGCLSPGKGAPLTGRTLARIQASNRRAKAGRRMPLVLCSGRSQPYIEAFCQLLDVYLPCVCENGAFLYDPKTDRTLPHPSLRKDHFDAARSLRGVLKQRVGAAMPILVEPGKDLCISLNPAIEGLSFAQKVEKVKELFSIVKPLVDESLFSVTHSNSAVDITPAGIDKAGGVRFLSQYTGVAMEDMFGIGDSRGDLPFLEIVGHTATVANGADMLGGMAQYISPLKEADGVLDIIEHWHASLDSTTTPIP